MCVNNKEQQGIRIVINDKDFLLVIQLTNLVKDGNIERRNIKLNNWKIKKTLMLTVHQKAGSF